MRGPSDRATISPMAKTVLIVDDHAPFRGLARALLQLEGFEVVGEAADALSALAAARRLQPSVVVLDVQLPDLDGFEVARRLARGGDPRAIVLVSSRDSSAYRRRLAESQARAARRRPPAAAAGRARRADRVRPWRAPKDADRGRTGRGPGRAARASATTCFSAPRPWSHTSARSSSSSGSATRRDTTGAYSPSSCFCAPPDHPLLDEPGCAPELAGLGQARPLLREDRLLLFGYTPDHGAQQEVVVRRDLAGMPVGQVRGRPPGGRRGGTGPGERLGRPPTRPFVVWSARSLADVRPVRRRAGHGHRGWRAPGRARREPARRRRPPRCAPGGPGRRTGPGAVSSGSTQPGTCRSSGSRRGRSAWPRPGPGSGRGWPAARPRRVRRSTAPAGRRPGRRR
jgi:CheY-like chemotaxis protein